MNDKRRKELNAVIDRLRAAADEASNLPWRTCMNYAYAAVYALGLFVLVMDLMVWRPL
jgi:hypothetical protein